MRVGRQNISINLTGRLTHWTQGATTAFFGAGIVVSSLTIHSATCATVLRNMGVLVKPDAFPNRGWLPIRVDGKTIESIAGSGAASEVDEAIAQTAIDALMK